MTIQNKLTCSKIFQSLQYLIRFIKLLLFWSKLRWSLIYNTHLLLNRFLLITQYPRKQIISPTLSVGQIRVFSTACSASAPGSGATRYCSCSGLWVTHCVSWHSPVPICAGKRAHSAVCCVRWTPSHSLSPSSRGELHRVVWNKSLVHYTLTTLYEYYIIL